METGSSAYVISIDAFNRHFRTNEKAWQQMVQTSEEKQKKIAVRSFNFVTTHVNPHLDQIDIHRAKEVN